MNVFTVAKHDQPKIKFQSSNDLLSMRHELLGLKKPISPRKKKQMVVLTSHGSCNSLGSFEEVRNLCVVVR